MKNWGYILLLTIGCVLAAVVVTLLIEMINLSYFKKTDSISENIIISSDEMAIDESANTPRHSISTSVIAPLTNKNIDQQTTSSNLLRNSSFELNPLTTPNLWQTSGLGANNVAEWSKEQAASGNHALKITATLPSNRGWPGWITQIKHRSNSGYLIQAKYFTTDGANAWLEISFLDSNNKLLKGFSTGCPRTSVKSQWTLIQHKVKSEWIPEQSSALRIGLRQCLNHTKGRQTTLFFDDVSLQLISD